MSNPCKSFAQWPSETTHVAVDISDDGTREQAEVVFQRLQRHGFGMDQVKETAPALLPCPFCGKSDLTVHCNKQEPPNPLWVECNNKTCQCMGPNSTLAASAIDAWNTRNGRKVTPNEDFKAELDEKLNGMSDKELATVFESAPPDEESACRP